MSSESVSIPVNSIAIIIAALLLSASLFFVGNSINSNLVDLKTGLVALQGAPANSAPSANPTPTPSPTPTQNEPTPNPTVQTKDYLNNAAGVKGDPNSKVVLIQYSDYQCPFCIRFYNDSEKQIVKNYVDTGKVLLLYKDFPLGFHPFAQPAAEAARCAGEQNKYWEFHEKIYAEEAKVSDASTLTTADLKKWAVDLGLDSTKFNSCIDTAKYKAAVQENVTEGGKAGVQGTPSFLIGKANGTAELVVGAQPYSVFQQALDAALK